MDESNAVARNTEGGPRHGRLRALAGILGIAGLVGLAVAGSSAAALGGRWGDLRPGELTAAEPGILPAAMIGTLALLGAMWLWDHRPFGGWVARIVALVTWLVCAGLLLLAVFSVWISGGSIMGAQVDPARAFGLALVCVVAAIVAGGVAFGIWRALDRDAALLRPRSRVDALGVGLVAVVFVAGAGAHALIPGLESGATSPTVEWGKFGAGVVSVTIGWASVPTSATDGSTVRVRVVTSLSLHVEAAPGGDVEIVGPVRFCLRYLESTGQATDRCFRGAEIDDQVNAAFGAPATRDRWTASRLNHVRLDLVLDRVPGACDYPPGQWVMELEADSPAATAGAASLRTPFDIPLDGPQVTAGAEVGDVRLCADPVVVHKAQGEPPG